MASDTSGRDTLTAPTAPGHAHPHVRRAAALAAGAMVGPYVVERVAAEGGFAFVYRAVHGETGEPVALKVLHSHLALRGDSLRRFRREAKAIAALRHPHIVEVRASGQLDDGRAYLAMEWLDGRDLAAELAQRGALTDREALVVAEQVGAALETMHARGIIHRDLKASNVMAIPDGAWFTTKLVDFGIAKPVEPVDGLSEIVTSSGVIMGTPETMAPEQLRGHAVDARTDVYALGLLLYRMVTGRLPFQSLPIFEIEELQRTAAPPPPSEMVPLSPGFDEVVLRCLAKDPGARFQRAAEVVTALRTAVTPHRCAPEQA